MDAKDRINNVSMLFIICYINSNNLMKLNSRQGHIPSHVDIESYTPSRRGSLEGLILTRLYRPISL